MYIWLNDFSRLPHIALVFLWLCYEYEMSIRNHFMELASQSLIDDLRDMCVCVCKHILYNYILYSFILEKSEYGNVKAPHENVKI